MGEIVKEIKGKIAIPYRWSYGKSLSRFFTESRDEKRLMGVRCSNCRRILIPPTSLCGRCYAYTEEEWIPLSDHGTLISFTIVYLPFPGQPQEPPYAYGYIKLDGADTLYPHLIGGIPFEEIKCGMRLKARWNEQRKGSLLDIRFFEPE